MIDLGFDDEESIKINDELIIFPIPREKKESIELTIEKLVVKACDLHSSGKISEASKYYQLFLDKGFSDPRVFSNYGLIRQQSGDIKQAIDLFNRSIKNHPNSPEAYANLGAIFKDLSYFDEAEKLTRRAIQIRPDFWMAYINLGSILENIGKPEAGIICTKKAIDLNPKSAEAHFNLGSIFNDLGDTKKAEIYTRKAIEINQKFAMAHVNLGNILGDMYKTKEAFDSFLKAIELEPENDKIFLYLTRFLKDSEKLSDLDKEDLKYILILLLKRNDITNNSLFKLFSSLYNIEYIDELTTLEDEIFINSFIRLYMQDDILILALKKITFRSMEWERFLTRIRSNLLEMITHEIKIIDELNVEFIFALSEQCFGNEYIYCVKDRENDLIERLINKCKLGNITELNISILSCYIPLHNLQQKILPAKFLDFGSLSFNNLVKIQIKEPLEEQRILKQINKIGLISNDISKKVQNQYEENPYPRWKNSAHSSQFIMPFLKAINSEINPNSITTKISMKKIQVLIAGCGTGQQILEATKYQNAQITAIDLSAASLAYAQRKVNEYRLKNIDIIQMDILDIALLNINFDVIFCSGVLHHMDKPFEGLKSLLNVLKSNGFLKLGLYSELARNEIVMARKYLKKNHYHGGIDDIRRFRSLVFSNEKNVFKELRNMGNFYTTSECRDLCFHLQESRYDISSLIDMLDSNNLQFLGFVLPKSFKAIYRKLFPDDKEQINLRNWNNFEEKFPSTFKAMYQFWVCKNN